MAAITAPAVALQTTYPERPIKLVTPFSPSGSSGITARIISDALAKSWQVPIVVDTRLGANGNIGAQVVAKAPPEGYTLLCNASSFILSPALYINPGYDALRDFSPISPVSTSPLVYVIPASLPVRTLREFVEYCRSNSGKLAFTSAGVGNGTHLSAQLFFDAMGITALHVPYKVAAGTYTDLIEARVQFYAGSPSSSMSYIKEGRIKALAMTSKNRMAVLPDVPTVQEALIPKFEDGLWQGIVGPAGMSAAIVNIINSEVSKVLAAGGVRARLEIQGAAPFFSMPEQYAVFLKSEMNCWAHVVRSAGIKPE